jgi:beta-phosphoglucomutase
MDAVIFDFDGVLVDSEGVHLAGFQQVLEPEGFELTAGQYYRRYLGFSDRDALRAIYGDRGRELSERKLVEVIEDKARIVREMFADGLAEAAGAADLVGAGLEAGIPMGICSGALRVEVKRGIDLMGMTGSFLTIVSAEDVGEGKPSPEGYMLALANLRAATGRDLRAEASVVIEDAPAGIEAARAAGMRVLAVATSYDTSDLTEADRVVASLEGVGVRDLEGLL